MAAVFEDVLAVVNRARRYEQAIADSGMGLTAGQLVVLHHLAKQYDKSEVTTMSDLARERNVSPAVVTQLVDALVAEGLIERLPWKEEDIGDRRMTRVRITYKGRQKHADCRQAITRMTL